LDSYSSAELTRAVPHTLEYDGKSVTLDDS